MGLDPHKTKVVSPDAGGVYRAKQFREGLAMMGLDASLAMIIKQRSADTTIQSMDLVGEVDGCDVIMVDDMIDTAGTLTKAAKNLKDMGAKRVHLTLTLIMSLFFISSLAELKMVYIIFVQNLICLGIRLRHSWFVLWPRL